jgi:hypothetical protein
MLYKPVVVECAGKVYFQKTLIIRKNIFNNMSVSPRDLNEVKAEVHVSETEKRQKECAPSAEEESTRLLKLSEISLWIDTYDDIFSDFDPRPYSQRALSDDFLFEAKKASREKTSGKIELLFLIPDEKRSHELEAVIRKRLHEHFRKHADILAKEIKNIRIHGLQMGLCGFILLAVSSYVIWKSQDSYWISLLRIATEPAGWFLSWEGMNQIVFSSRQKIADLEFYRKMAGCDIEFYSLTCQANPKAAEKRP